MTADGVHVEGLLRLRAMLNGYLLFVVSTARSSSLLRIISPAAAAAAAESDACRDLASTRGLSADYFDHNDCSTDIAQRLIDRASLVATCSSVTSSAGALTS